ncbi:NAD-dependent deacetylase sirtuin 3 [Clonorchis sinensis]|uniref:NAD-dependent deacetylase sirtuin 3 n=1 Tax=Clonorchis sinensis TaxID=79923 RepID=G7YA16_CLOSI|nr:NAD-dependent deacetylase sirtuin 3 [Clonorchis sinensis]
MSSDSDTSSGDEAGFSRAVDILAAEHVKRIIVLTGAGISTASGIPDFRTPGTGLYDNLSQYKLPWPEAVFDLEYFYSNPVPFYTLAKELYPTGRYRPNIAHHFIRLLYDQARLLRVYTQNIDSLERMAGIPSDKLVEAHGTFLTATCTVCRSKVSSKVVKDAIDASTVAKCPECHNVVKPDIVFFGENLPERFWEYPKDLAQTDLVIVMGTSLEVYPFAGVADSVPRFIPRILINRESVGSFRYRNRPGDIVLLGSITGSIQRLSESLGWVEDLTDLMGEWRPNLQNCLSHSDKKSSPYSGINSHRRYSTASGSSPLCGLDRLASRLRTLTISHTTRSDVKCTINKPNRRPIRSVSSTHRKCPPWETSSSDGSKTERDVILTGVYSQPLRKLSTMVPPTTLKSSSGHTMTALRQYLFPDSSVSTETDCSDSSAESV